MYKLIIADDESYIRNGLKKAINWSELGFELCEVFDDGEPLLQYINKYPVDVIITDIKMSSVSGIDIARHLHEIENQVIVVFISGYKEFDLAQQAIEYGVEKYILKPINIIELKLLFSKIKNELDLRNQETENQEKMSNDYRELLRIMRNQWVYELYFGISTVQEEIVTQALKLYPVDSIYDIQCYLLDIGFSEEPAFYKAQWNRGAEALDMAIFNIIEEYNTVEFHKISGSFEHALYVALCISGSNANFRFEDYLLEAKKNLQEILGISAMFSNIYYCEDIIKLSKYKHYINKEDIKSELDEYKKLIVININQINIIRSILNNLFDKLQDYQLSAQKSYIVDFLSFIRNYFLSNQPSATLNILEFYEKIMIAKFTWEIHAHVENILDSLSATIQVSPEKQEDDLIKKAQKYIDEHYQNDLSLTILADKLYVNRVYLCRAFKEKSGGNFLEYLTNVRITKAMELLQNQIKISTVCKLVGFPDARYFAKIFRSRTGMSPSEYLKIFRGDQQ
jgi:Response regulator containing CheY-like receiver domain and AraC-type DNA-binding domain